ncbi:Secondary metabolism regulator LAE1 [Colletotrichum fructicola]|nr:Secondary metabolism regulator LAE1 [Colletotrichum fructicola]
MSSSAVNQRHHSPHHATANNSPADDEGIGDDDDYLLFSAEPDGWKSMTSSIKNHVHYGGRRYHRYRDGKYPFPNDMIEQGREYLKHDMITRVTEGRRFHAPIGSHPQKILDLGTGVGVWAIEVADTYPGAQVVAVDLSPIQPDMIPGNVDFLIDDIGDEWVDPISNDFDFIHARDFLPYIADASMILDKAHNHLKPGGWIETQDFNAVLSCDDGTMPEDFPVTEFWAHLQTAQQRAACDLRIAARTGELLHQAGFINVQCRTYKIPIGPWAHDNELQQHVGGQMRQVCADFLGAAGVKPFSSLGMTETQIQGFLAEVREALNDDSVHTYMVFCSWVGQKAA